MDERNSRSIMVIGQEAMDKLATSKVIVFGIGGVGGYVIEALARGGIGEMTIVDKDVVSESNRNRQIIADTSTIGEWKSEVMYKRLQLVAPECKVKAIHRFYLPDTAEEFDLASYDYVADAIDNVTAKMELISRCNKQSIPLISCMGTGNKLDASRFQIADIYDTSVCPLARVVRKECKTRGIEHLKVVYSREVPKNVEGRTPGSVSFVPGVAGMLMAGEIIKDLVGIN